MVTAPRLTEAQLRRPLFKPTPAEIQVACETLLRCGLSRELRAVVREIERNNAEKIHERTC